MKKFLWLVLIIPSVLLGGCGKVEDPAAAAIKMRIAELSAEEAMLKEVARTTEARLKEIGKLLKNLKEAEQVVTRK
jgi:hypothetical protein